MKTQTIAYSKHIGLSIVFISIFLIQVFSINSFILFPTAQFGISTTSTDQTSQSESSMVNTPPLQQVVNNTPIINTDSPIIPSKISSVNSLSSDSSTSNSYSETIRVDYNNYATKSTSTWQTDYANYNSPSVSTWQTQYTNYVPYTAQKVSVSYVYSPITPYFYNCQFYTSTTISAQYLTCWWNNNGLISSGGDSASDGAGFTSGSGGGTIWVNIYATLTVPVSLAGGTLTEKSEVIGNWWTSNPGATLYLDSGSGSQYTVHSVPYGSYGTVTPTLTSTYWQNPNYLSFRYWLGGSGAESGQNGNAYVNVDEFIYQPPTQSSYVTETATDNNAGTITHAVTFNPVSASTVTVTGLSGWTYVPSSISNVGCSVSGTTTLTITGCPIGQDTTVYFTSSSSTAIKTTQSAVTTSYYGNGLWNYDVTVNCLGSQVSITEDSGLSFIGSSQSYSTASTSGTTPFVITGLPYGVDSVITFRTTTASTQTDTVNNPDTVTYDTGGVYTYVITVHPMGNSLTLHNATGTELLGNNNKYTTLALSSGNSVFTGLPFNTDTLLTYIDVNPTIVTQTVYPLATSSYTSNGHFVNQVTVNPEGSSVTIYNSTGWVFSSASNSYSSISINSDNNAIINGLPIGVDSLLTFISDNSGNAYSIEYNTTLYPTGTLNPLYEYDGNPSLLTSSTLSFGASQGSLLGNYFVNFVYYDYSATSIKSQFNYGGSYRYQHLPLHSNTWSSAWIFISCNAYSSNVAFSLIPTGSIYFAYATIYNFNYTVSNDHSTGNLLIAGDMNYLTDHGVHKVSTIIRYNTTIYGSSAVGVYSQTAYTDSTGHFLQSIANSNSFFGNSNSNAWKLIIAPASSTLNLAYSPINYSWAESFDGYDSPYASMLDLPGWKSLPSYIAYDPNYPYPLQLNSYGFHGNGFPHDGVYSAYNNQPTTSMGFVNDTVVSSNNYTYTAWLYFLGVGNAYLIFDATNALYSMQWYELEMSMPSSGKSSFYLNYCSDQTPAGPNRCYVIASNLNNALFGNITYWQLQVTVTNNPYLKSVSITASIGIYQGGSYALFTNVVSYPDFDVTNSQVGYILSNNIYIDTMSLLYYSSTVYPAQSISGNYVSPTFIINDASYIMNTNSFGESYYTKIYLDSIYQGVFSSGQVILKNSTAGSHTLKYQVMSSSEFILIGVTPITTLSYTTVVSNYETIVIRDQQDRYVATDTFNCYYNGVQFVGGTFYVVNTASKFNLTISDPWGDIVYQNTTESWATIKNLQITLYSVKIQNYQSDPVWVQLQRGSGATFSQWVFSQEVIGYDLLGGSYTLTYHFATVNSSTSLVNINSTSYTSYNFDLNDDIAFRITGISLQDIFSNIASVFSYVNTTNILLKSVNVSIGDLGNQSSFAFKIIDSNMSIFTNILSLFNSSLNGNFSIFTQTLSIAGRLQGDFSAQSKFLSIINSSIMDNVSLLTEFLNITSSIIKGGNITLQTQLFDLLHSSIYGNLTLITENSLNTLAQLRDINASLLNQLAFQVIVSNFYLSDNFVNVYAASTKDFQYSVYENNSLVTSGSGLRAGTIINYPRNIDPGSLVYVSIKFINATNTVWYNTSYTNGLVPTDSLNIVLVSPGGIVLNPFPVLTYVNYSYIAPGKISVNKTVQLFDLSQSVNLPNDTLVTVTLKSGFGDLMYNNTFHLTSDYHLTVQVNITTLTISNSASTARIVELWRHNVLGYNATINPGESIGIQLLPTSYLIKVYSVLDTPYVDQYNNTITKQLLDFTTMTLKSVGSHIDLTSGSSLSGTQIKSWISQINPENMILVLVSAIVGALATVIFSEMAKRIATQRFREKEREINDVETLRR